MICHVQKQVTNPIHCTTLIFTEALLMEDNEIFEKGISLLHPVDAFAYFFNAKFSIFFYLHQCKWKFSFDNEINHFCHFYSFLVEMLMKVYDLGLLTIDSQITHSNNASCKFLWILKQFKYHFVIFFRQKNDFFHFQKKIFGSLRI